jgi:Family of unknown function (DUF6412)
VVPPVAASMPGLYPYARSGKRSRWPGEGILRRMLLWGFWVLAALLDPAFVSPSHLLVGGLAVLAAALLVVAAAGLPVRVPAGALSVRAFARRSRTASRPRLIDPDAAGRPRSRAPSAHPAAA